MKLLSSNYCILHFSGLRANIQYTGCRSNAWVKKSATPVDSNDSYGGHVKFHLKKDKKRKNKTKWRSVNDFYDVWNGFQGGVSCPNSAPIESAREDCVQAGKRGVPIHIRAASWSETQGGYVNFNANYVVFRYLKKKIKKENKKNTEGWILYTAYPADHC